MIFKRLVFLGCHPLSRSGKTIGISIKEKGWLCYACVLPGFFFFTFDSDPWFEEVDTPLSHHHRA